MGMVNIYQLPFQPRQYPRRSKGTWRDLQLVITTAGLSDEDDRRQAIGQLLAAILTPGDNILSTLTPRTTTMDHELFKEKMKLRELQQKAAKRDRRAGGEDHPRLDSAARPQHYT